MSGNGTLLRVCLRHSSSLAYPDTPVLVARYAAELKERRVCAIASSLTDRCDLGIVLVNNMSIDDLDRVVNEAALLNVPLSFLSPIGLSLDRSIEDTIRKTGAVPVYFQDTEELIASAREEVRIVLRGRDTHTGSLFAPSQGLAKAG